MSLREMFLKYSRVGDFPNMTVQETGEPGKGGRFEISVPKGLYRGDQEDT